jgi:Flp pilus assembly protein CpaB
MPYARSKSRGIPTGIVIVLVLFLASATAVGSIGTLWAFGKIDLPFLSRGEQVPPGSVVVFVSGKTIPAYTKLTREDIWDSKKSRMAFMYVPQEQAAAHQMITDYEQIIGRVLNHEKPEGYGFTEKDFLPKGTRAGLAGAIPPGKRSMLIEVSKISGLYGLKVGDHIDLVATIPVEMPKGGMAGRFNSGLQVQTQMASMQKLANVRILAQDAVMLTPVTRRQKPVVSKSISQGTLVKNVPVEEVVIAVDPGEVAPVTQALATDVDVMCVVRSGRPGDPEADTETPGSDPLADLTTIDTLSGGKREYITLPQHNSGANSAAGHTHSHHGMSHHASASNSP